MAEPIIPEDKAIQLRESGAISDAMFDRLVNKSLPDKIADDLVEETKQDLFTPAQGDPADTQQEEAPSGEAVMQDVAEMRAPDAQTQVPDAQAQTPSAQELPPPTLEGFDEEVGQGAQAQGEQFDPEAIGSDIPGPDIQASGATPDIAQAPIIPAAPSDAVTQVEPQQSVVIPPQQEQVVTPVEDPFEKGKTLKGAAAAKQVRSIREMAAIERLEAKAEQQAANRFAKEEAIRQARQEEIIRKTQQKRDKAAQEIKDLVASYTNEDGSPTVTTQKLIDNMGTGRKIAAFIGIALGGLGGGENQALKAFNASIDRDIRQIELGRKAKLKGAETLFDSLEKQLGNAQQAKLAYKNIAAKQMKHELEKIKQRFSDQKIRIKADAAIAKLQDTLADTQIKLEKEKLESSEKLGKIRLRAGEELPQGADLFDLPDKQRNALTLESNRAGVPAFLARGERQAKQYDDIVAEHDPMIRELEDFITLADNNRVDILRPGSEARALGEQAVNKLVGLLRVPITGPGVLTDADIAMIKRVIGNPTQVFSIYENQRSKLVTLMNNLKTNVTDAAKRAGWKGGSKKIKSFKKEDQ